jgi:hypothetical protein
MKYNEQISKLEQKINRLKTYTPEVSQGNSLLQVLGGQELISGIYGIKRATIPTLLAEELYPGAVDKDGVETVAPSPAYDRWEDGLGFGNLWRPGHPPKRVIIANFNYGYSFAYLPYNLDLIANTSFSFLSVGSANITFNVDTTPASTQTIRCYFIGLT